MSKCRACGKKLSMKHWVEYGPARIVETRTFDTEIDLFDFLDGEGSRLWQEKVDSLKEFVAERYARPVVKREQVHDKPGPYGDGYFCSLRCGHAFAVLILDKSEEAR